MKKTKKILLLLIVSFTLTGIVGCKQTNNNGSIDLTLEQVMEKLYEGIDENQLPNSLTNIELDKESVEYFIGTNEIEFEEALANEPAMSSVAHSVVLLKVTNKTNIESAKTLIKENVDPRKWICVEAEEVIVDNIGNLIILIMSSKDLAKTIHTNFSNLK